MTEITEETNKADFHCWRCHAKLKGIRIRKDEQDKIIKLIDENIKALEKLADNIEPNTNLNRERISALFIRVDELEHL